MRLTLAVLLPGVSLLAVPALAQEAPPDLPPAEQPGSDEPAVDEIVVTGTRLRGQVITSSAPIAEYDEADVQALGAGSLTEVLEALGPQVQSGRGRGGGGRPLILVNGRRISDFRELGSYPPEAVQRVSILPEEVALQYGFPPDQRVVNFILKNDFASREVELEFEQPDRGGYRQTEMELTYLRIDGPDRLNANLEINERTGLTDAERGVVLGAPVLSGDPDPARFRSLVAPQTELEATLNWSRGLGTEGAGGLFSVNGSYNRSDSRDLEGLATVLLVAPNGDDALRALPYALSTRTIVDTYAAGSTFDRQLGEWRLNATLNASVTDTDTRTVNPPETEGLVAAALAGTVPVAGGLPPLDPAASDRALSRIIDATPVATLTGQPFTLPAGEASLTLDAGYRWQRIEASDTRQTGNTRLTRGVTSAGANISLPITRRDEVLGALGDLNLQLGAGVDHFSDFGTLWDANLGITWKPTEKLTLQATYIPREAAPSLTQLGAPVIVTPNVPVFDLVTGRTALVAITRGGNPDLVAERQRDLKLALNWELPEIDDLIREQSIDVEFFRNRSRDVSAAFPLLTPDIEAAFPGRITRAADGTLLAIDQSPVTFARQDSSRVRVAVNLAGAFSRDEEGEGGGAQGQGGGRSDPGAMLRRGPPSGGRWRLTLDYTRELENTVLIAEQGPELDLLNGDALVTGGVPTDRIGARLFGFYKGFGGRVAFDWFSATEVRGTGLPGSTDLRFGSLAQLDLRLFADLERVIPEEPALKGVRVSFLLDNVFDARQRVTDAAGDTPARFQPFLLDPTGRFVGVEVRKLFL